VSDEDGGRLRQVKRKVAGHGERRGRPIGASDEDGRRSIERKRRGRRLAGAVDDDGERSNEDGAGGATRAGEEDGSPSSGGRAAVVVALARGSRRQEGGHGDA
jgi:hypothetical protein